jgi:hypothetical protein
MLDEIVDLWPAPGTHAVLNGIVGYRQIIAYANGLHIPVASLPRALPPERLEYLAQEIAHAYLEYAQWQERELPATAMAMAELED